MKILFTGLDDANHVGGIETYIYKILRNIDRTKYQIDFLAFNGSNPCFFKEFVDLGCKFNFVCSRKQNAFRNVSEIKKLFAREKYDIVHCHLNSLSYITPCVLACKAGIPVIVHSRNGGGINGFSSQLMHKINFIRMKMLPVVRVAVSDVAGKWMFGKNGNFLVLNNGIESQKYLFSAKNRMLTRTRLGLKNEEVFINVGAFRKQKNHTFLISIFEEYLKKNSKAKLLLVGDGPLRKKIQLLVEQKNISANVLFLGNRSDIPDLLCAADKFLFPSLYEGFPNALLEAETAGLWCVASDLITRQVAVDGCCMYVSLDAPISKWVEAMSAGNIIDRLSMQKIIVSKKLDINAEISRLMQLYSEIV